MPAKFTVYKDKKGEFRFNLKAANGEIVASGESYPDKKSALKGIASIQKNAPTAGIEDTTEVKETVKKTAAKGGDKAKAAPKPRGRKSKGE